MRLLLILICAMFLASCHSARVAPRTEPVILNNTDETKVEYIERVVLDTVIVTVTIPAETAKQVIPDSTSHLETNFAESDAWINPDGTLGHSLTNKPQAFKKPVVAPRKEIQNNQTKESFKEVPVPYPEYIEVERNFTNWERIRLKGFYYLLGLLILMFGWKYRKLIAKIIGV